jgi:hypothetical protein
MRSKLRADPDEVALWWITIHFHALACDCGIQSRGTPVATCGWRGKVRGATGTGLTGLCAAIVGPLKFGGGMFLATGSRDAQPTRNSNTMTRGANLAILGPNLISGDEQAWPGLKSHPCDPEAPRRKNDPFFVSERLCEFQHTDAQITPLIRAHC